MNFWEKLKAFFSTAGVEVKTADNAPLTQEQEAEFANSLEFTQLLQSEQAMLATAQTAKIESANATLAALTATVAALTARTEAAESTAADALAKAENAQALVIAVGQNAETKVKEVAQAVNKIKGAPMDMQAEDKAVEGAPEAQAPRDSKEGLYQNLVQYGGMSAAKASMQVYGTSKPPFAQ